MLRFELLTVQVTRGGAGDRTRDGSPALPDADRECITATRGEREGPGYFVVRLRFRAFSTR